MFDVDYTKVIPVEDLGLDPKQVSKCSPSTTKYLFPILDYMKFNKNLKILDIGSGKGFVIKFFKQLGYRRVNGLEISRKLYKISINNFKKDIIKTKIYNIDACNYKFYKNHDIFYLYNPFPKKIAARVFSNIKSQIEIFNKRFYVIYANPVAHKILIKNGFVFEKNFPYIGGNKIAVYFYN